MAYNWLSDLNPALKAQELWYNGQYQQEGFFHLTYRTHQPLAIACGAALLADHVRTFRFSPDVITRLGQAASPQGQGLFSESFLNHLQRLKLRVSIWAPAEGTLLLPGEPLLIVKGPLDQVQLLESALFVLVWRSAQWATRVASERWQHRDWQEEDTPPAPAITPDLDGWKTRAAYIGGAGADHILDHLKTPMRPPQEGEGLIAAGGREALTQIRRLYRGQEAVGDVWLNEAQDLSASVSRSTVRLADIRTGDNATLRFTRFQNLYQPVLVKGHPVLSSPRISYLRQRTLKQLEAFHHQKLDEYPRGRMGN